MALSYPQPAVAPDPRKRRCAPFLGRVNGDVGPLTTAALTRPTAFARDRVVVARYGVLNRCEWCLMNSTVETLEAEALRLSNQERARLVERLIASLDTDSDIEDAWAAEVERRNTEIESGAVSLISGPEALDRLKAEFR